MSARYATLADVTALGLPAKALAGLAVDDIDRGLEAASRVVDSYLGTRFTLPLVKWDASVTLAASSIAAYRLLAGRGFAPGSADAEQLRNGYNDAIHWLEGIAKGRALPSVVDTSDSATPPPDLRMPFVVSEPRRGW